MEAIQWTDDLSVGVKKIDEQHKTEIDILNRLSAAKQKAPVFLELAKHTVKHFATEEKYFDEFGYEKTKEHKLAHKKFLEQAEALKKKVTESEKISEAELQFIKKWLVNHIVYMDKQYTNCFRSHGLK